MAEITEATRTRKKGKIAVFFLIAAVLGLGLLLVEKDASKFNAQCPRDYFCDNRCPVDAISLDEHGFPQIDKSICLSWVPEKDEFDWDKCGLCLQGCPTRVIDLLNSDLEEREKHTLN